MQHTSQLRATTCHDVSLDTQGVLMLNNVMTVRQSEANSHKNQGWENFTDAVIRHLNRREGPGCVISLVLTKF